MTDPMTRRQETKTCGNSHLSHILTSAASQSRARTTNPAPPSTSSDTIRTPDPHSVLAWGPKDTEEQLECIERISSNRPGTLPPPEGTLCTEESGWVREASWRQGRGSKGGGCWQHSHGDRRKKSRTQRCYEVSGYLKNSSQFNIFGINNKIGGIKKRLA